MLPCEYETITCNVCYNSRKGGALMEIRNVGNRIMNTWIYPLLTKNKQHIEVLNLRPLKHK